MNETKTILLAEDDAALAELIIAALTEQDSVMTIVHVQDGAEALDYLRARGKFEGAERPAPVVVLLDLKMPRVDGLEVLRQVKSDPRLRTIPVVMLTSSQDEDDLRQSYQFGANAYVVKPVEFHRFTAVLKLIAAFWTATNKPPPLDGVEAAWLPLATR